MFVDFNILNQLGSPSINSNTFANRPAAGQTGRLFVSTDTFEIYRDNGTGWDLIGGPGAGTITGTGTATQVAYFTGAQTIGSSANLFWDNTAGSLGINTATPGAELDVHGTGTIAQFNTTAATGNVFLALQRTGTGIWRIGDTYNGGSNYFELHNVILNNNAAEFQAATNKATFGALETYSSGGATGSLFSYTITVPGGTNFTGPNVIGNVNSALVLNLGGNTTVPNSARQGLEGNSRINFTGAGTLTMTQGTGTVRAFSALSSVYSFSGSAVGTVTHLAGLRICFPDNIGSAINITNNYGLLLNDQTTGTGTVTYTNRWGIYQEGASDLNYFNGNLLIKSTTNTGEALQVTGTAKVTSTLTANSLVKSGGTASQILAADGSVITAGTNITIAAGTISASGGLAGSGTTNYLPKFTAATTVGDSRFFDNGTVTFFGNGDVNAAPSTGIFSGTGGSGTNIAGAELRIRGGASTGNAAGGSITFYTSAAGTAGTGVNAATERMRITNTGVGIGTTTTDNIAANTGMNLIVQGSTSGANVGWVQAISFDAATSVALYSGQTTSDNPGIVYQKDLRIGNATGTGVSSFAERVRIANGGNVGIATSTIGSRLQVNGNAAIGYSASTAAPTNGLIVAGQSTFSDAVTVTRNQNAFTSLTVSNTTNNTGAYASVSVRSNSNGLMELGKYAQLKTAYKILSSGAGYIYNADFGDIAILNDVSTGNITFAAGGSSTAHLTITSAGNITLADAVNIAVNTTTGTKIGTATNQKLAFWNATPIVQPTTAVAGAARVGGGGTTVTDTDTFGGYTIAQVVQALRNTGILA